MHEGDDLEYEELQSTRLSGILLTVIVRKKLRKHILQCRNNYVSRGIFNALGNKGAVAVSLQFNEANICFINSHLAANTEKVAERNDDFRAIEEGMKFEEVGKPTRTISDHE